MPGENLTRIEAEERAALVTVHDYDVVLDVTTGPEVFRSTTTVRFAATEGASTFIDAITAEVHSVTLNGVALDPAEVSDGVRIQLSDLAAENELVVVADGRYMHTGEGLHRFVDPVDGEAYLYTQFEVPDSRRMFAVFEQPDLKAAFRFTVTAPAHWEVVSNSPTPEPVDAHEGAKTWAFEPTPRISSYITALIAGPYAVVRDELTSADGRVIPLGVFSRKSLSQFLDADYIFEKTKQGFEYFEAKFGVPYPFAKYDQLFVPEYNAGAMENAGAVTFTEFYVFRSKVTDAVRERRVVTILHELAHMWFGDLVTMKWWNDLWLNESFAEWASTIATAEATEWTEAWTTFNSMEKSWAYRQDQLPSTHPVVATINDLEDVQVNFDGITYAKGGSVLKQLVAWVGVDAFFAGVSAYFQKHEWGNTTLADLLAELEVSSGRDLSDWSGLWLETAGVNTLRPEIETDDDGHDHVASRCCSPRPPTTRRSARTASRSASTTSRTASSCATTASSSTSTASAPRSPSSSGLARPDLVLLNDDDLAYAKIRLDEASHGVALANLSEIEDPLARALVWSSVWDATRDAETRASDYLALVLGNIASETESTTLRIVLANAVLAASAYTAPERRAETRRAARRRLLAARAGGRAGQRRAVPVRDELRRHRRGRLARRRARRPLRRLARRSRASRSTPTSAGSCSSRSWPRAAPATPRSTSASPATTPRPGSSPPRTRAPRSRPSRARSVPGRRSSTSTPPRTPSCARPRRASSVRATRPCSRRSSSGTSRCSSRIWDERSYAIAEKLVDGLYPSPLANRALADASRAWLDTHPDVPALRRLVIERLAGIDRALAAQARDAQDA